MPRRGGMRNLPQFHSPAASLLRNTLLFLGLLAEIVEL